MAASPAGQKWLARAWGFPQVLSEDIVAAAGPKKYTLGYGKSEQRKEIGKFQKVKSEQ